MRGADVARGGCSGGSRAPSRVGRSSSASPISAWPIDTSCTPGTARRKAVEVVAIQVVAGVDAQAFAQRGLRGRRRRQRSTPAALRRAVRAA